MDAARSPRQRSCLPLVVLLIAPLLGPGEARGGPDDAPPALRPYILPEAEEVLMELWGQGKLRDHPLVRAMVARRAAEQREAERDDVVHDHPRAIAEVQPWMGPGSQALGVDVIANDRSLSNCLCPSTFSGEPRPVTQSEPSVAAYGPYVVAAWNDRRGACIGQGGSKMSYGYSRDYGATFQEGQLINTPSTGFFTADPTVAVNAKTGAWYISGLRTGGIGVVKGHFTDTGFVIDFGRQINHFSIESFDKPWMAVDSTSGNVYVSWTSFPTDESSKIDLQRLDADLNPLGPIQELIHTPPYNQVGYGAQVSYTAVGPDGVLYVAWQIYYSDNALTVPVSRYEIVRSDDNGQTFGPIHKIADMGWNIAALAPGNLRTIWAGVIALAVDMTHGPHRGRVYATWAEVPLLPDPVATGPTVEEVENNDYFASAMPITPGGRIHGSVSEVGNNDFFKFEGQRGQILRIWPDKFGNQRIRLICPADTSDRANYHHVAIGSPQYVCGLPYDGTYYLQVTSEGTGAYEIATVVDQAGPGGRVQDVKDPIVTWSDDGATWSTPVRLNDDMPGSDTQQVGVSVDGRGRVHAFWFDWRDDPECGVISNQYMASSGDGGVTWGANRKLTDAPSFWGALASCSANNQGDYSHMAASGDYVYSAFPDMRMGDPDIFVDVSRLTYVAACPANTDHLPGGTATLDFSLANQGNFDTSLAWRVTDSAGWLSGATPALEGSQTLAGGGGTLNVQATLMLPATCGGESTLVQFISHDPFVPGYEEVCTTVVRCDTPTPTALSLVGSAVRNGTVTLRWHGGASAGVASRVDRRAQDGTWAERGRIRADASGVFLFEESGVPPGRYVYRLAVLEGEDAGLSMEAPIEVPSLAFALHGASAEPSGAGLRVSFTLASAERARLEIL
ncbi:MAG TPA: hypothetical protein VJY35_05290, partial [Candidatus Eisenbacteria bacterium]|nr:hypothetical protein [Candidatus Eisenbacteria bacterium]